MNLRQELRYAARSLRGSPLATTAAVVSLALGIGAAAAVFSIADAIFFRTLDVPHPEQLVSLYQRAGGGRGAFSSNAFPHYEFLRDRLQSLRGLAAFSRLPVNAQIAGPVERLTCEFTSDNYFQVLGATAALGRVFAPGDGHVVVMTHRFWRERYASDPGVLGRTIVLNAQAFTIIGVLPETFQSVVLDWGKPPQLWLPLAARDIFPFLPLSSASSQWMLVAGRLKPGVTAHQLQSEIDPLSAAFYDAHPMRTGAFRTVVLPTQQARFWPANRASVGQYVWLIAAVAGLTFFMACFNVASLMLGRAARRQRELGIQIAIGAGRPRLARGLLLESALIAIPGAALGLALAGLTPHVLSLFHDPFGPPLALNLALSPRIVLCVTALAGLACVLVGLLPARLAWRLDVASLIKNDAAAGRSPRFRLADALVAAQVSTCLLALAGASLFLRTLHEARASDPFFRAGNALMVGVDLLSARYDEASGAPFLRNLLARVRQLPGVETAAYIKTVPLGGLRGARDVRVEGVEANVQVNVISPGYFAAAGLPLLRGRDLVEGEAASVIVNEAFAQSFFPGQEALGRRVGVRGVERPFTIAGVVRDGRMRNFREPAIAPCLYVPLEADYQQMITLYVRTAGPAAAWTSAVRGVLADMNRDVPFESTTLETHLDQALARERLAAALLTGLGLFTTLLAALGLYGVISLAVSQRSRELGIRLALGAQRRSVVVVVMRRFLMLVAAGAALGLAATAALGRFVQMWLFGVRPLDPFALGAAIVFLLLVAMLAAAAPAVRAARTDPLAVIRQE